MWKLHFIYFNIIYASEKQYYENSIEIIISLHNKIPDEKILCNCKYFNSNIENITDDFFNNFYNILYKKKNSYWNIFNRNTYFNPEENYYFNLFINILQKKNYKHIVQTLCTLQKYNKIYEFIGDALYESAFFNDYCPSNITYILDNIKNIMKEKKKPLIENDNILFLCSIMNIFYKHLLINKEMNEDYLLCLYKQARIQIVYEYNQYDVEEKKIEKVLLDFQEIKVLTGLLKIQEKYYEQLVKFKNKFHQNLSNSQKDIL